VSGRAVLRRNAVPLLFHVPESNVHRNVLLDRRNSVLDAHLRAK